MFDNGRWENPKIVLYCQVGKAVDMLDFALNSALKNAGMPKEDFDIFMICWKTSDEVYEYLREKKFKYIDMDYDSDKDFLWNLYKGWNLGLDEGFKHANYVCPIATDHAFYKDWLKNLYAWAKPNRIVNCKLIEPGTLHTIHIIKNLGVTTEGSFREKEFIELCESIYKHELITDEKKYGRRLDAMPWICSKDVWERFGPQSPILINKITGDVDFFNRIKDGGVENTKALDSISYHCGGLETRSNKMVVTTQGTNKIRRIARKLLRRLRN